MSVLHDRARIFVQAGSGGDGCVSFRREAHVPKGGPDGGDGGRGADIVVVCDQSLRDLGAFRRGGHFKAARGGHGQGGQRHGASPDPLEIRLPRGTVVDDPLREARYDLVRAGQRAVVAAGGSGGRGNRHFTSATRQAPRFAERGLPGEEGWLELRLKLLADAGLVGLPNAGKSSLLARLTRARPKVAGYPFTTLEPVLGTLQGEDRQLVVADIPGLIEGAGAGAGLGHEFLGHLERTRLLVHVVELVPPDGSDPQRSYATVEAELSEHGAGLGALPRILCLSKADLAEAEAARAAREHWSKHLGSEVLAVIVTSAATGAGIEELKRAILRAVPLGPDGDRSQDRGARDATEHRVYRPGRGRGYRVERAGPGGFRVVGEGVERLAARHDLNNEEALRHLEDRLRAIGVIRALEAAGFEPGDDVEIAGTVFELDPGVPFR